MLADGAEEARTALDLGLVLEGIVGLHTLQELLLAARGVHVLHAHMDAFRDDASVHLRGWPRATLSFCG